MHEGMHKGMSSDVVGVSGLRSPPPGWQAGPGPPGPGAEPPLPAAPGADHALGVHALAGDGAVWLWLAFWRIVCWGT